MTAMRWLALPLLLLSVPLAAQDSRPHFRGGLGLAGGSYTFDSDLSGFRDDAVSGLLQAEFEATSRKGFGGGIRYEYFATDRNEGLFRNTSDPLDEGTQARSGTLLAHATFRVSQHRFTMPVRIGLLINGLTLDEHSAVDPETRYLSIGPFFEIEPELTLVRAGKLQWSIYAQLGVGIAGTAIDVDGDPRDYQSASAFGMVEAGTRLHIGPADIGIAFIGRYQSMDRSDFEGNQFVYGFDSSFQGVLISAGFSF
jgi:hypothetical protein